MNRGSARYRSGIKLGTATRSRWNNSRNSLRVSLIDFSRCVFCCFLLPECGDTSYLHFLYSMRPLFPLAPATPTGGSERERSLATTSSLSALCKCPRGDGCQFYKSLPSRCSHFFFLFFLESIIMRLGVQHPIMGSCSTSEQIY